MAKDIRYAIEDAASNNLTLETGVSALSVFQRAIAKGHGDEDMSAVVKSMRHD